MMSQYHMMPPVPQTFVPMFGYPYHMETLRPPPNDDGYVLDLSVKRHPSPDYTMCYPSPKMSPNYGNYENQPVNSVSNQLNPVSNVTIPKLSQSSPVSSMQSSRFLNGSNLITNVPKNSPSSISDGISESSYNSDASSSPKSQKNKATRPFKALSKDCLTFDLGVVSETSSGEINNLIQESLQAFTEFRDKMLEQIRPDNGTNKNMRRTQHNSEKLNDPEYMEKRRKNNEAAKKSRDARKSKQDEMAIRMAFLEREHMMLKCRLDAEKEDLERMQKLATRTLKQS